MELKPCRRQFCIRLGIAAARENVMADRLTSFLSSLLTVLRGLQVALPHFPRPLPIMVAFARCFPKGLLPDMAHLMDKR